MANTAKLSLILKTIKAVGEELNKLGLNVDVNGALKAAEEAYESAE